MRDLSRTKIIVVGGGVAGLAAATLLTAEGHAVTLLERNNRLGGRTYSFVHRESGAVIDNGQHILVGCYTHTLRWLGSLGQTANLKTDDRMTIPFRESGQTIGSLTLPRLPAPFHLIFGILQFTNLSLTERLSLLSAGLKIKNSKIRNTGSVDEWLSVLRQSARSRRYFWDPVCLAVMNERPSNASAEMFAGAIRQMFLMGRDNSKIILPRVGLTELFAEPAAARIKGGGGEVHLNMSVESLCVEAGSATGVRLKNGEFMEADEVVLAVPPAETESLCAPLGFPAYTALDARFKSSPIISIYIWLERDATELFHGDFVGCIGTTIQWVFRKSARCLELTVSDAGSIIDQSKQQITQMAERDMASLFPGFDIRSIAHFQIIKELRATYTAAEVFRPDQQTPIRNLFVAGDWTNTGLPATIESAVKSAYLAVAKMNVKRKKVTEEKTYA